MRIAVIGAGISGLVTAYLLSESHDIVVYEANDYIGGHTHTIDVPVNGRSYAVDTGFIVFNENTYPNFITLMQKLGVSWQPSGMSFSVQCDKTGLYFCPSSLSSLFAQRKNLFRPSFYRMLADALRFRREASELIETDDYSVTLQEYLDQKRYSTVFIDNFIIPMGGAIWSADPVKFREFPARYLVEFFNNHGVLNTRNQPRWLVIKGGSRQYIEPLTRPFRDGIRLGTPVSSIRRFEDRVEITSKGETDFLTRSFWQSTVIRPCEMLKDPDGSGTRHLGVITLSGENLAVLHTDASLLPPKKSRAWASWNYHIPKENGTRCIDL